MKFCAKVGLGSGTNPLDFRGEQVFLDWILQHSGIVTEACHLGLPLFSIVCVNLDNSFYIQPDRTNLLLVNVDTMENKHRLNNNWWSAAVSIPLHQLITERTIYSPHLNHVCRNATRFNWIKPVRLVATRLHVASNITVTQAPV